MKLKNFLNVMNPTRTYKVTKIMRIMLKNMIWM